MRFHELNLSMGDFTYKDFISFIFKDFVYKCYIYYISIFLSWRTKTRRALKKKLEQVTKSRRSASGDRVRARRARPPAAFRHRDSDSDDPGTGGMTRRPCPPWLRRRRVIG